MERKYPLGDLDSASYQLKCAVDTLGAVHDAIEYGPNTAESYKDAIYGVYCHMYDIAKEIQNIYETLFKQGMGKMEASA